MVDANGLVVVKRSGLILIGALIWLLACLRPMGGGRAGAVVAFTELCNIATGDRMCLQRAGSQCHDTLNWCTRSNGSAVRPVAITVVALSQH